MMERTGIGDLQMGLKVQKTPLLLLGVTSKDKEKNQTKSRQNLTVARTRQTEGVKKMQYRNPVRGRHHNLPRAVAMGTRVQPREARTRSMVFRHGRPTMQRGSRPGER